jgi:3-hydroxyisobutyrate dehydrogenase-like beta-hydroxyacid dehydrogenase
MTHNLLKAGLDVTVYNRTTERCAPLAAAGATVADSPAEVARTCQFVITIVADGAAAEAVFGGSDGVLAGVGDGTVVLEMSTIGPPLARELAERVRERGGDLIDAPVSGSVPAAEQATLIAMVGGDAETFERARPVLAAITRDQYHLGPQGAGAAMKLVVNSIIGVTNLAISEGLVAAEGSGIARERAYEVLADSAIASPYVHYKRDAYLTPDDADVFFTVRLLKKDLALAIELGRENDVPMLGAAVANESLTLAIGHGYGQEDVVRLADTFREMAAAADAEVQA